MLYSTSLCLRNPAANGWNASGSRGADKTVPTPAEGQQENPVEIFIKRATHGGIRVAATDGVSASGGKSLVSQLLPSHVLSNRSVSMKTEYKM